MDLRDSLLLIELDKGGDDLGPLFEEPRRRLKEDDAFRGAWSRYQGLKALAWEAVPELEEKLIKQGLRAGRRQELERRLARATGSQDAARELLLKPEAGEGRSGLPAWAAFLLLVGAIGLGWMAFRPYPTPVPPAGVAAPLPPVPGEAPLAFEFPEQDQALSGTAVVAAVNEEADGEDAATRKARRLVNEHLRAREGAPEANSTPRPTVRPTPRPTREAPTKPLPVVTELSVPSEAPTPLPTEIPTPKPTTVPTEVPTVAPTKVTPPSENGNVTMQKLDGSASEFSLALSNGRFPSQALLGLPGDGNVDLRLFDMRGRLVRRYLENDFKTGKWRLDLNGKTENGTELASGTYYLRIITPWGSKVEALEKP